MKPVETSIASLSQSLSAPLPAGHAQHGRGWRVFIDGLEVTTRIGIHAYEHAAPQAVVVDASLAYRGEPSEEGVHAMIDYERYCERISAFLRDKVHTRMLETLAVEIAALSFQEWPALDALTLALHKPKIREGARRVGVELDWTRADYDGLRSRSARSPQA